MKIELEQKDLDYIDYVNEDLAKGENVPLFIRQKDNKYIIEFTCRDVAKANLFACYMMSPDFEIQKEILNKFGISVDCISYSGVGQEVSKLKEILSNFLNQLEGFRTE